MKVLLVEDHPVLQANLRETLAAEGFEIAHVAATRADALRWLREGAGEWDLGVIDIFLREGHGFDVLRACVARDARRRAVVLSNYTREPARASALALGADAVFDKSYEMDEFVAYCANVKAGGRQRPEAGEMSVPEVA